MIEPTDVIGNIRFFNCDAQEFVRERANNEYDACFSDPPYGIGMSGSAGKSKKKKDKKWDEKPMPAEFFEQQKRISKTQFIWGANHFIENLPLPQNSSCWLLWDKREGFIPERTYADAEMCWTSLTSPIRVFRFFWDGFLQRIKEDRIHPTQKPVSLYEWKLMKFCTTPRMDRILDPFGGSFSSAIACYNLGFPLDIIEMDTENYQKGLERFKTHVAQANIWTEVKKQSEVTQGDLFE
jgi:site-specific DNA-methyltransferase (adenine-specific)